MTSPPAAGFHHPVLARLREEPWTFSFYQAVRWLEALHPDHPPFGTSVRPKDEPVRFCQEPSLTFAPSTLSAFDTSGTAPKLFQRFQGLLGPNGPMPLHLTEYVHQRVHNHEDATMARFLDLFHHRFLSLFYRAWARCNIVVSFELEGHDRFSTYVASLFGAGMKTLERRDAASVLTPIEDETDIPHGRRDDVAKRFYCGLLAAQARNAGGLAALLSDYFRMPVAIEEFIGQWLAIPVDQQCQLGMSIRTGLLGENAIAGARVWDCQYKFGIRCGPLRLQQYRRMLPLPGEKVRSDLWRRIDRIVGSFDRLVAWVKNYIGDELKWNLQLVLHKDEVPSCQLGDPNSRLGMAAWLKSEDKPFPHHAEDLVFEPIE